MSGWKGLKSKHSLYNTYHNMVRRCYYTDYIDYKNYGARGITVDNSWLDKQNGFWKFVEDMGIRPKGFTLDRIDNDKGYSKENCKWSSWHTQQANRRNNSKYIGVYYIKRDNKYCAELVVNRKYIYGGRFAELSDAVNKRKELENNYLGALHGQ